MIFWVSVFFDDSIFECLINLQSGCDVYAKYRPRFSLRSMPNDPMIKTPVVQQQPKVPPPKSLQIVGQPPRDTATPCRAPGGGTIPLPETPPPHPIRRTPAR